VVINQNNSIPSCFCHLPIGAPDKSTDSRAPYIAEWIVMHFPQFKSIVFPCNPVFVEDSSIWSRQGSRNQESRSRNQESGSSESKGKWMALPSRIGGNSDFYQRCKPHNLIDFSNTINFECIFSGFCLNFVLCWSRLCHTKSENSSTFRETDRIRKVEQIHRFIKLESFCSLRSFRNS
jgi:hypothetical protein